jgi:hypothetical protein
MSTIFEKEGGISGCGMDSVVVGEFGSGQPIGPIVLHEVGVEPEILFQFLIGAFGLTIGLWMIGSRKGRLDA